MAKNAEQTVPETQEQQAAIQPAPVVDDGMVTIKIPLTRSEKDDVYVSLNGMPYLIQRGAEVRVPRGVAEILQHSEEMLREAIEFESQYLDKE